MPHQMLLVLIITTLDRRIAGLTFRIWINNKDKETALCMGDFA